MNTPLHEVKSPASSSYVTHYHMTREPFGSTIEDDLFYTEPGRQQKLDILLHLTQYGNELVIVTGPAGSGKTSLLQQYVLKAMSSWSIARIDAKTGIDERKLLQQLFHQMGMDFHGATHSELFERMQHHFDALQHSARQAVLLIDNAEQLPITALKRVLEMAELASAEHKPLLRVILFSNNTIDETFDDPLLAPHTRVVRRNVELLPFSQEQTAHYILHRLSAANFAADKPFTDAALHKIHKQTHGWPGEINHFAHNLLIETLPAGGIQFDSAPGVNKLRIVAVIIGITLLGSLLIFQDDFNAWLDPEPTSIAAQVDSTSLPVERQVLTEAADEHESSMEPLTDNMLAEAEETISPIEVSEPDTTDNNDIPAPAVDEISLVDETPSVDDSPLVDETPQLAETITTEEESQPAPQQEPVKTSPPPAATSSPIPADLPGFRNAWIIDQNADHYTLQLVAGNNLKTLRSFIRQHTLDEPLAIYHTTRKGKPWFGLIQHTYPSKQAAINARSQLPTALREQRPWVRQFADVQKGLE